ncbi:unnamed protein product (macronuclear) [Paramecium tetraurelia]|uniref:Uncharacterized protein n=1 Tax=Paramecium tetraurelia TaxID=5888 RepID=A0D9K0_PARTE|nr:uncharacterized protein GSPATT00014647001 [Paramecium tetraurelia]CAK79717.1 unnamed protein product [Paramecium tetraurelia]|eukprot:XP_001447114.1 hypothetical protein (macronuclear) [Paramecium tetraurelia strain d4-2]
MQFMRQQKIGLFSQSQVYVTDICEPLNILEFLDNQVNQNQSHPLKLENLKISNKSNQKENSHQIIREIKQSPYGSGWANKVLGKQFGVQLSQITQRKKAKWIIKKLKPSESNDNSKQQNSRLINDIKSHEEGQKKTASKSNDRRFDKIIKGHQKSFSGFRYSLPTFDINFFDKIDQYNL